VTAQKDRDRYYVAANWAPRYRQPILCQPVGGDLIGACSACGVGDEIFDQTRQTRVINLTKHARNKP
jgi:hypothetical protein